MYHYIIFPFHKSYFSRKNVIGEFLNSYGIIHSFVAFACCWITLLCCFLTVNWFLILLSSVKLFLTSENKIQCKSLNHGNWKWSILKSTCSQCIFTFWRWDCAISFKAKPCHMRNCLLRIFMVWPNYYLSHHLFSGFCLGPRKNDLSLKIWVVLDSKRS